MNATNTQREVYSLTRCRRQRHRAHS